MTAFYLAVSGHDTFAADINQYANTFNGTSTLSAGIILSGALGIAPVLYTQLSATPSSDSPALSAGVTGDTSARSALYLRSDGYGGVWSGTSTAITAHLYAQSAGWMIPESLTVSSALTVSGSTSMAGLNTTSNVSIGAGLTVSGTTTMGNNVYVAGSKAVSLNSTNINGETINTLTISGVTGLNGTGTADLQLENNSGGDIAFMVTVGNHFIFREVGQYAPGYGVIYSSNNNFVLQSNIIAAGIGFKNSGGSKLAEMLNNGNFSIGGGTYYTNGSNMTTFHVAETYPVSAPMPPGTVCCPGMDGLLKPCQHDACPHALIRCQDGGYSIGEEDATNQYCAIAGRVPVNTRFEIGRGIWVTSDGKGGVRRIRSGEAVLSLGYALQPAKEGKVWIVYRPVSLMEVSN